MAMLDVTFYYDDLYLPLYTVGCILASIPAPLTRGPGIHCLRVGVFNSKFIRVGVFNSKFISKTVCNLSINLLYYGHPRG